MLYLTLKAKKNETNKKGKGLVVLVEEPHTKAWPPKPMEQPLLF
jgi:hypothetical protein